MLKGKNILLGVTGGIAAYKAVEIVSRLRKKGANVHVLMSRGAQNFVTPLTFRELSNNPVVTTMWDPVPKWNVEHIALAQLADLFLIAPATANVIGKIAAGLADDMITTTVMATQAPVFIAAAMNSQMYGNPIVQKNLDSLRQLGYHLIPPASGLLACGVEGVGRLPEPEAIVKALEAHFIHRRSLAGKKILITAAGTQEAIDPVRYIGNRSSGKMGYAIAQEAVRRGADVTLVSGPSALKPPSGVRMVQIESAGEMMEAVLSAFPETDIVIKAAAVADYRPQKIAENKIKKSDEHLTLVLEKNPDILLELGKRKRNDQILIGFAAETQDLLTFAQDKLKRKNLDMLVANDVTLKGAGFNSDTNIIKLLYRDGRIEEIPKMSKNELSGLILDRMIEFCIF